MIERKEIEVNRNSIMDDVDMQMLVHKLIAGEASQDERDKALATVMLSLWSQHELKELIRMVHNEECAKCPLKSKKQDDDVSCWRDIALKLLQCGGWLILIAYTIIKNFYNG